MKLGNNRLGRDDMGTFSRLGPEGVPCCPHLDHSERILHHSRQNLPRIKRIGMEISKIFSLCEMAIHAFAKKLKTGESAVFRGYGC
jgi:hypothetical protein